MSDIFDSLDLTKTIRDFDFTRKAIRGIHRTVDSEEFENMDADTIKFFLINRLQLVSFKDQLKRYLWNSAGFDAAFGEVSDHEYAELLHYSFEENRAPFSFEPTTRKSSAIIKSWLSQDSVRRDAVFLLGFGLRMTDEDASAFLTKVLNEDNFNFSDVRETVFWFCFRNQLPYAKAKALLNYYSELKDEDLGTAPVSPVEAAAGLPVNHYFDITNEDGLKKYLIYLKTNRISERAENNSLRIFTELLDECRRIIADVYNEDAENTGKTRAASDISPADVEKFIFSGVPVTKDGNMQKLALSTLSNHFRNQRLSRQKIDGILKKKQPVGRADLITLVFFIYSQKYIEEIPDERCRLFIDKTNQVLTECGFAKLYLVNSFEAFVMLCMLTDTPLATFSEVWELSYE